MNSSIQEAVTVVREGGIIIFPTDTAFGIGCRMDDEQAVEKLFSLRNRPSRQAVPVLFNSVDMVRSYVQEIPSAVNETLIDAYWPGALTIILPAHLKKVPALVRGGGIGIGCRIPSHQIPLTLIDELEVPLIGTSANFSGAETPYQMSDIDPRLLNLVDYVVPGTTTIRNESTVINCLEEPWVIVRQGAVTVDL